MSLEATIQENTNAIRELIAAIQAGVPTTAAQVAAVVTEAATDKLAETVKEEAPAKKPTTAKKAEPAPTQPTAEAVAADAPEQKAEPSAQGAAPTYQATADAVTSLARTKGREAAVAVLTKFGASKLPDVKPEQFAAVIAECEAVGA